MYTCSFIQLSNHVATGPKLDEVKQTNKQKSGDGFQSWNSFGEPVSTVDSDFCSYLTVVESPAAVGWRCCAS